jgi:hypothetical protein
MSQKIPIKIFFNATILLALLGGFVNQGQAWGSSEPTPQVPTNLPSSENSLYLPMIRKGYPAPPPVYGVETFSFSQWKLDKATQANVNWVRNATFSWAEIEPTAPNPGHTYNWSTVNNAGLIEIAKTNLTVIAVVKNTPSWAQKTPGLTCGPIVSTAWQAFYDFVFQLVSIYSAPPYNIRYFEFGNEPDVDPAYLPPEVYSVFGCWADPNDPYYGGGYYAELLKRAYPAAKLANPQVMVLNGGLLLDCDPRYLPPGKNCLPAQFLEGMLRNQGAAYFDILAFHGYPYYGSPQAGYPGYNLGPQIVDENHASFYGSGGQVVGKIDYLRYVMGKFGVSKPIIMTEVGLQCKVPSECGTPPSNAFLQLQADYVVQTYVRTWALNLWGTIWYTLEDSNWNQTGMFTGSIQRPAYDALVFMTNELKDMDVGAQLTLPSGLRGYEFTNATKRIWVLWAPNGITGVQITLPANVNKIYDKYGSPTTTIPSSIIITHPTYIEFLR